MSLVLRTLDDLVPTTRSGWNAHLPDVQYSRIEAVLEIEPMAYDHACGMVSEAAGAVLPWSAACDFLPK